MNNLSPRTVQKTFRLLGHFGLTPRNVDAGSVAHWLTAGKTPEQIVRIALAHPTVRVTRAS